MKAAKIAPSDPAKWTEPPTPVQDGPHRTAWLQSSTAHVIKPSGNVAQSCLTGRHEEDIDANGYYQNALRALEAGCD